jgi:dTDP-4-dehydrorhamnose reductase
MKLLLTGSKGQVGWSVQKLAQAIDSIDVIPTDLEELDIADPDAVRAFCDQQNPQIVLNAAAYTAVDKAQQEKELAYKVNARGPQNLAAVCAERNIPLLHISTDYVYNGSKQSAYIETDPIAPQSAYGETKAMGDAFVIGISDKNTGPNFSDHDTAPDRSMSQHIILRTAWVYAPHGNNFVKTMLRLATERDEINVVADQRGNPTCATDIAAALLEITNLYRDGQEIPWGTYHYTGQGPTTWYDFTREIFTQARQLGLIQKIPTVNPITTAEYPTPAKRPANSVLNCDKIKQHFPTIHLPKWQDSLNRMLKDLLDAR